MMHHFDGTTASEVWQQAATAFCAWDVAQYGQHGVARELLHVTMSLSDPRQRWVNVRTPPINPAFAIAEVIWILNGRRDAAFLTFWNRQLPCYAGETPTFRGAYGHRLRSHFDIDQLERAFHILLHVPESRQVVLQIWDACIDLPDEQGQATDRDIPCNVVAMLKVRNGRLEWMQIIRSNDIYRGLPYNLIQFTSLQEIMAGWLGAEVGSYNQMSDSLHLYQTDEQVMQIDQTISVPHNTDSLALPKAESEMVLQAMARVIERMIEPDVTANDLSRLILQTQLPPAYRNLLSVLGAEAARRHGWQDRIPDIIGVCTNYLLMHAWERWYAQKATVMPQIR